MALFPMNIGSGGGTAQKFMIYELYPYISGSGSYRRVMTYEPDENFYTKRGATASQLAGTYLLGTLEATGNTTDAFTPSEPVVIYEITEPSTVKSKTLLNAGDRYVLPHTGTSNFCYYIFPQ